VLVPRPAHDVRVESGGYPIVACRPEDPACWGEEPTLVLDASRKVAATPSEAFMICREVGDVSRAAAAGCRPVIVLAGRSLDEVFGAGEPDVKAAICAPTFATATDYILQEAALDTELGAFPFAHGSTLDEKARAAAPSRRDITRLMAAVVVAGVAVSLGIAYILQELYQMGSFPEPFYYLTLQFIPQYVRGALFLAIGAAVAFFALVSLDLLPKRSARS
jgi:hypothetical protein